MKKTIVTVLALFCLSMVMMVGCGNKNNSATQTAEPTTSATDEPVFETDKPTSGGAIGDVTDDLKNGAKDVGNGIEDAVDDAGNAVDDAVKNR